MKIQCQYCQNMINDTDDKCSNCGAPNPNVVRTSGDTPRTIAELQQWYKDRGLPPYKTTRFFIGVNYKAPRAFGIYQDKSSGNFIVYKNKDSGERVIRYEGSDEAYAVNELYLRLKQEILEQKANGLRKSQGNKSSDRHHHDSDHRSESSSAGLISKILHTFLDLIRIVLRPVLIGVILLVIVCVCVAIFDHSPDSGYYTYQNQNYYYDSSGSSWFTLNADNTWNETPLTEDQVPEALQTNKTSGTYLVSTEWSSSLSVPDFDDTTYMQDRNTPLEAGYYDYHDTYYYNVDGFYSSGWYIYDDGDWKSSSISDVPEELQHAATCQDFYYTPDWDSTTQISDFEDSDAYREYTESESNSNSDNNSDFNWDSGNSWDSGNTNFDTDW